jgi:hypothetical protein
VSNVKRRTLVLTIIAGLLVFIGVLGLYLPASWLSGFLPAQIKCSELGGSLWSGECLGLQAQGTPIGDATWDIAPGNAVAGRLVGDVAVRGRGFDARADVDLKFNRSGELRNVTATFPLDPAFVAQFPRDKRGKVLMALKRMVLNPGGKITAAEGIVELHDLRQVGAYPLELGSYRLTFDGVTQPNGAVIGQLRDLGGPFLFEGTLTLSPPNTFVVNGTIAGRTADAEKIVREITVSPPDASGRSAFSYEDSY